MSTEDLAGRRRSYTRAALELSSLGPDALADPLVAVRSWLDATIAEEGPIEATAMVVSTVGDDGVPDARAVLCKGIDHGLVFYTNRSSAKGRQLAAHPVASATFVWTPLERQIRVRGSVEVVDDATGDAYFATRPRGSQIGAWASQQSEPVADRAALEAATAAAEERFAGRDVPRPPTWGGYRIVPDVVELWQGRRDRLHDRLVATRSDDGWTWQRLMP